MTDRTIGLTERESKNFSVARWMRAVLDPSWGNAHAGFELAVADELRAKFRVSSDSLITGLPLSGEVMNRTLTATGGVGTGGAIVETEVSQDQWAPALRAASRVIQLGATVLPGKNSLAIPREKPASTVAAVAENASRADSDTAFELVTYTPNTIRGQTVVSRRLLVEAPVAEYVVRDDLMRAVAEMVDFYAIQGTGSGGQPTGILSSSPTTVALGTNGAAPTYAAAIDCVRQVALKKNLLDGKAGWIASTKAAMTMRNVSKTASWGFIWDDAQQPEYDGWICGYRAMMSENVPSNLTKGSGTNLSALIFGNWNDLYIIEFSPPVVMPDGYTYSNTGAVRFNVYQEVDIKPRRIDAFSAIVDMIAS